MDSAATPARSNSSRTWAAILSLPSWNAVSGMAPVTRHLNLGLHAFFSRLLLMLGDLLLCLAPHLDECVDQTVDRLLPLRLAPHPDQSVQQLVNRFAFFCHAAC